jgi:serine/threonine protein kinase
LVFIVSEGNGFNLGKDWDGITDEAKNFIKLLLEKDFNKRPTAVEALKHDWIIFFSKKETLKKRFLVKLENFKVLPTQFTFI